jgi:hypothetical protein
MPAPPLPHHNNKRDIAPTGERRNHRQDEILHETLIVEVAAMIYPHLIICLRQAAVAAMGIIPMEAMVRLPLSHQHHAKAEVV